MGIKRTSIIAVLFLRPFRPGSEKLYSPIGLRLIKSSVSVSKSSSTAHLRLWLDRIRKSHPASNVSSIKA